ncbi:hypothetical protein C1H46_009544 [Malus baccata]|uniref:Uncharacterized protein n=1 Tax=Malus baccata TaxID=106549 RepID=A0A540N2S9_MALBA|nr:hypothetical protein C1H46_009544 [Malus baccata]
MSFLVLIFDLLGKGFQHHRMRCMWILGPILSHLKTLAICAKESRWRGGELQVDSVMHVASIIRRTQCFKPNYFFVIIDFLSRHRYISPESFGYLDLLQSLRSDDCS